VCVYHETLTVAILQSCLSLGIPITPKKTALRYELKIKKRWCRNSYAPSKDWPSGIFSGPVAVTITGAIMIKRPVKARGKIMVIDIEREINVYKSNEN